MEYICVYLINREKPISFFGKYLGHNRPDGQETDNWHYYRDDKGRNYHFRKEHIQCVISSESYIN